MREMGSRYLFIVLYAFLEQPPEPRRLPPPRRAVEAVAPNGGREDAGLHARRRRPGVTAVAERRRGRRRLPARRRRAAPWGWPALAGLLVLGFAVLVYSGHDTAFFFDEWNFVSAPPRLERRLRCCGRTTSTSRCCRCCVYKTALRDRRPRAATRPTGVAGVLVHLTCVALLFAYARRRVGDRARARRGAAAAVPRLRLAVDILWPFQIGFLGSLAAGLGALLALDREDRRGDVVAAVLLGVALASRRSASRCWRRRWSSCSARARARAAWWVVGAPLALYAALVRRLPLARRLGGRRDHGRQHLRHARATWPRRRPAPPARCFGLDPDWGRILIVGVVAAVVVAGRDAAARRRPWRLAVLAVLPLAFWSLTAATRASINEPATSRYLYPGALFLLLLAVEAARGRRATPPLLAVLAVLLLGATVANVGLLRDGARALRDQATQRPRRARRRGGRRRRAARPTSCPRRRSRRRSGSAPTAPRWPTSARRSRPRASCRATSRPRAPCADEVLMRGYGIGPCRRGAERRRAPAVEQAEQAGQARGGGCLLASPRGDAPAISVTVPARRPAGRPGGRAPPRCSCAAGRTSGPTSSGQAAPGQPRRDPDPARRRRRAVARADRLHVARPRLRGGAMSTPDVVIGARGARTRRRPTRRSSSPTTGDPRAALARAARLGDRDRRLRLVGAAPGEADDPDVRPRRLPSWRRGAGVRARDASRAAGAGTCCCAARGVRAPRRRRLRARARSATWATRSCPRAAARCCAWSCWPAARRRASARSPARSSPSGCSTRSSWRCCSAR